ncbi:unnamed protein product [Rotaria sp. Silwood1]|nr:unnamed protein product [Rotaria sp. Silwood1]CAF1306255.1 unnamed protein product [Rotaria sp. Silwood1]
MKIPSSVIFSLCVKTTEDIVGPIKTEFKLHKVVWGFNIEVPCTDGDQVMHMPMEITTSVPSGEYSVEIKLTSYTGQKGCVKITKIKVEN